MTKYAKTSGINLILTIIILLIVCSEYQNRSEGLIGILVIFLVITYGLIRVFVYIDFRNKIPANKLDLRLSLGSLMMIILSLYFAFETPSNYPYEEGPNPEISKFLNDFSFFI
ncbi:MAG: hypothetical protein GPJ54_22400 [Candidatus Heimdallarchaeota archaeon]|nr:hypothetical protein [Candidatus Heimdallarchaeota archaeon]